MLRDFRGGLARALLGSESCHTPRELFRCLNRGIVDNTQGQRCLSTVAGHDTGICGTRGISVAIQDKVGCLKVF